MSGTMQGTHPEGLRNEIDKVFAICCNLEAESQEKRRDQSAYPEESRF